jgi:hypothetical protein
VINPGTRGETLKHRRLSDLDGCVGKVTLSSLVHGQRLVSVEFLSDHGDINVDININT